MTPERFISTKEFQDWGPEWKTGFFSRLSGVPRKDNPYKDAGFRAVWNGGWDRADALIKEAEDETPERDPLDRLDEVQHRLTELELTQYQDRSEVQRQLESEREAVRILKDEVAVLKTRLAELQERFADSRNMFHAWSVDADARIEELESKVEDLTTSFRSARMMQERQEARLKDLDQKIEATADALEAALAEKDAAKPTKCATGSSSRSAWQSGILPDQVRSVAERIAEKICEESGGRKDTESSIVDIVMREIRLDTVFTLHPAAGPWEAGYPVKPGPWLVAGPSMGVLRGFVENDTAGTFVRVGKSNIRPGDGEISHYARIYPPGKEPTDE